VGTFTAADKMHRLVKQALDSGEAASLADAQALFASYRVAISLDASRARDAHCQAALLTAIALARRVFLGGVLVAVPADVPLFVPLPYGRTLYEAVKVLGGHIAPIPNGIPIVDIDGPSRERQSAFHIRTIFAGWRGGIVPHEHSDLVDGPSIMALAPMLAAALAINEAFLFVSGQSGVAGRRCVGLSLWNPSCETDWLVASVSEPALTLLPSSLWLIGLGHLGQAYLWALGLLPYADDRAKVRLVLQDVDVITPSTESTSILSDSALIGQKKTRAMAAWAETLGFKTTIQERLFGDNFRRLSDEPAVALCGVDNGAARQALDRVGFDFVVEAGLGRGYRDFRAIRLHTLPASRCANEIWKGEGQTEDVQNQPAYAGMVVRGELDQCGVTLLAGRAVGAPFVGAVAATLVIAEVLRLLHGGALYELIDLDLKALEYRSAIRAELDFGTLNPGFVPSNPKH
jgi:hypothetical protein